MLIERSGVAIRGRLLAVTLPAQLFSYFDIAGTWSDTTLQFQTTTVAEKMSFTGRVEPQGTGVVDVRGEIAVSGDQTGYTWTATCKQLAPGYDTQPPTVTGEIENPGLGPGEEVRIRIGAQDDTHVWSVTIFLDGSVVKRCHGAECRYSGMVPAAGQHIFWAEAEDVAGNVSKTEQRTFQIRSVGGDERTSSEPSVRVRSYPDHPTTRDRIKFTVEAEHPSGMKDVKIVINSSVVKVCHTGMCEYEGGPYDGAFVWFVEASGVEGGSNVTPGRRVFVAEATDTQSDATTPGQAEERTCTISGKATGSGANAARFFTVFLFRSSDTAQSLATKNFDSSGRYSFGALGAGTYELRADSQVDKGIGAYPTRITVQCRPGASVTADFELR